MAHLRTNAIGPKQPLLQSNPRVVGHPVVHLVHHVQLAVRVASPITHDSFFRIPRCKMAFTAP